MTLFELLADRSPDAYIRSAEDHYETSLDLVAVTAVLSLEPLTATLNSDVTVESLAEIGYAVDAQGATSGTG